MVFDVNGNLTLVARLDANGRGIDSQREGHDTHPFSQVNQPDSSSCSQLPEIEKFPQPTDQSVLMSAPMRGTPGSDTEELRSCEPKIDSKCDD